jgi:hypothetical protein
MAQLPALAGAPSGGVGASEDAVMASVGPSRARCPSVEGGKRPLVNDVADPDRRLRSR